MAGRSRSRRMTRGPSRRSGTFRIWFRWSAPPRPPWEEYVQARGWTSRAGSARSSCPAKPQALRLPRASRRAVFRHDRRLAAPSSWRARSRRCWPCAGIDFSCPGRRIRTTEAGRVAPRGSALMTPPEACDTSKSASASRASVRRHPRSSRRRAATADCRRNGRQCSVLRSARPSAPCSSVQRRRTPCRREDRSGRSRPPVCRVVGRGGRFRRSLARVRRSYQSPGLGAISPH